MLYFSFYVKCNYCEGIIFFIVEVERDMWKYYNFKYWLYCNVCKKSDFNIKEEFEVYLFIFYKDGVCFNCYGFFKLVLVIVMYVSGFLFRL